MLEVQSGWDLPPWRHNTGKGADESKKSILPHLMSLPLSTNRKIMNFHRHTFSWFFHIFCIFNYGKLLVDDASKCQNAYDWKSDATPGLPALITSSDNEEAGGSSCDGLQSESLCQWLTFFKISQTLTFGIPLTLTLTFQGKVMNVKIRSSGSSVAVSDAAHINLMCGRKCFKYK